MDLFTKMLDELHNSDIPTIMYGAGMLAERITDWLEEKGLNIDGYAVDEKYYLQGSYFNGKAVYSLEKYISENCCNVIAAFKGLTEERESELQNSKNVGRLYALDFHGRLCLMDSECHMDEELLEKNKDILQKLRDDLADEESRLSLDRYIYQTATGVHRKEYSMKPQYFDDDIISFGENETFIDCGAYDGDTILKFIEATNAQCNGGGQSAKRLLLLKQTPQTSKS